jgi:uncharacterized membrane protein
VSRRHEDRPIDAVGGRAYRSAMRTARPTRGKEGETLAFERLVFFSDAVFAIAITLLVIEIRLPEVATIADGHDLAVALWSLLPRFLGFLVSFVVVGSFWMSHHRMFRLVRGTDGTLLLVNLLFLLFVAFIPFPTAILGRYVFIPEAEALYAGWVAAAGFAKLGVWLYSVRRRLVADGIDAAGVRLTTVQNTIPACLFAASIPLAWVHWIAPIVVWVSARAVANLARLVLSRRRG